MKKIILIIIILCAFAMTGAFGQTIGNMISHKNIVTYNSCLVKNLRSQGQAAYDVFTFNMCDEHYDLIAMLGGNYNYIIDTPEELFLASYVCPEIINGRTSEAKQMLPKNHNNDIKAGAFIYQNLQIATFLRGSNATAYTTLFNEFCAENNITRTEIETFYRNGIRGLVGEVVDEQVRQLNVRVNNETLSAIKNSIMEFMLVPSRATYNSLLQTYRKYAGNGALVLGYAMTEINPHISEALADNRVLGH